MYLGKGAARQPGFCGRKTTHTHTEPIPANLQSPNYSTQSIGVLERGRGGEGGSLSGRLILSQLRLVLRRRRKFSQLLSCSESCQAGFMFFLKG